ncbi:DeoR/GlpR family DNA-binding transcription regulator [Kibdelosporangium aridum]|uniref:DeoR/GlpR family DNA-binding transcription regulator n=1 Tax=Kibdelosporangium aridum TaxID=2030 RepID=UPI000526B06F
MYAEERQLAILELARGRGRVEVTALADEFAVTSETIRRDLTTLEHYGVIRRVRGGAVLAEPLGFEPEVSERDTVMIEEKERIAKAALAELPQEGAILLDAGTTTARMAYVLPTDRELTVVTQSVSIALSLATRANITTMLVGGRLRSRTLACVESWAVQALRETFVDVAFIATNGLSIECGLTTPDLAEAVVKRAAMASARRLVLLVDHTKVGDDCLVRFAELSDFDTVITDTGIDSRVADQIAAAGPRVVIA